MIFLRIGWCPETRECVLEITLLEAECSYPVEQFREACVLRSCHTNDIHRCLQTSIWPEKCPKAKTPSIWVCPQILLRPTVVSMSAIHGSVNHLFGPEGLYHFFLEYSIAKGVPLRCLARKILPCGLILWEDPSLGKNDHVWGPTPHTEIRTVWN